MDLSRLILPEIIFLYFDCVHYIVEEERVDLFLEEKLTRPIASSHHYSSKGFRSECIIQDFPIRGKSVFLHIKRRKWLEEDTGKIISNSFDISHIGTQISEEFAFFLKESYRGL